MANAKRIPIPLTKRWQCFRRGPLAPLSFGICVALTLWLWHCQAEFPEATAETEVVRLDVAAGADGVLVALPRGPWAVSDAVEKGEMIAQLDDRPTRDAIRTVQSEVTRLARELDAAGAQMAANQTDLQPDNAREAARLAWELERRRLDALDCRVLIENDRVQMRFHQRRIDYLKPLVKTKAVPAADLDEQVVLRDEVIRRIDENERALEDLRTQANAAQRRLAAVGPRQTEVFRRLAPIHVQAAAQEVALADLAREIEALEIRAPIRGTINRIYCWPGQRVRAGDPIVAIAATGDEHVVRPGRPEERVRPAAEEKTSVAVLRPGTAMGSEPHRDALGQLQGGLSLRIALPARRSIHPGELIDATLKSWENRKSG